VQAIKGWLAFFFCFKMQGLKIYSCGKYRVQANSKRNYRLAAAY